MLIIGNKDYGLARSLSGLYPDAHFMSRTTGYNLGKRDTREQVAKESTNHDVVLLVSALGDFSQVMLAEAIAKQMHLYQRIRRLTESFAFYHRCLIHYPPRQLRVHL